MKAFLFFTATIIGVSYYNYSNQTPNEALRCHSAMSGYKLVQSIDNSIFGAFSTQSESDELWLRSVGNVFENCTLIEAFKTIDVDETEVDLSKGFDKMKKQLQKDFSQD